jgi:NADPH2:quinone reductase
MADEMRAWRVHEYGEPLDVLRLETVAVPEPDAGDVRVRVEAIPLNLNDLERINGGNMAVRPEFPYAPGMEVMGVVDACGPGTEDWLGARVAAMPKQAFGGYAEYAICPAVSMFSLPDDVPLPDAAALSSRSTSRGSACSTAPTCSPASRC